MKYIIDLPEGKPIVFMDGEHMNAIVPRENEMYVFNGAIGAAVVKLTPYADEIEQARKAGQDEAWEMARDIYLDDGMTYKELNECFGMSNRTYIFKMPITEAMKKYEAWTKEKDEIHVGDEMEQITCSGNTTGLICVVTKVEGDSIRGVSCKGDVVLCSSCVNKYWRKTGRHFTEVETLLEKMRNDE